MNTNCLFFIIRYSCPSNRVPPLFITCVGIGVHINMFCVSLHHSLFTLWAATRRCVNSTSQMVNFLCIQFLCICFWAWRDIGPLPTQKTCRKRGGITLLFENLPLDLPNMGGSTKIHWRQATQYDTQTASKIVTRLQRENITHALYLPHRSQGYKGPPESLEGSFGKTFW